MAELGRHAPIPSQKVTLFHQGALNVAEMAGDAIPSVHNSGEMNAFNLRLWSWHVNFTTLN